MLLFCVKMRIFEGERRPARVRAWQDGASAVERARTADLEESDEGEDGNEYRIPSTKRMIWLQVTSLNVEAILRQGIKRYSDQVSTNSR